MKKKQILALFLSAVMITSGMAVTSKAEVSTGEKEKTSIMEFVATSKVLLAEDEDEELLDSTPSNAAPSDETPSDEIPSDETPSDEIPSDEIPSDETPSDETPSDEILSDETPSDEILSDETLSDEIPSDEILSDEILSDEILLDATPSDASPVSTEEELREAVCNSGTVTLENDIVLTERLLIPDGVDLALEGYSLSCEENSEFSSMIIVGENAEVELSDIVIDGTNLLSGYADESKEGNVLFVRGSLIINNGAEIIYDQNNQRDNIEGIRVLGTCRMLGGVISGFSNGGVSVAREGEFTLEEGEFTGNGNWENPDYGGGAIGNLGKVIINGGTISDNVIGIFNCANMEINAEGTVSDNLYGIVNNNKDHISGEQYAPELRLNGCEISDNEYYAIDNRDGGTIYMEDGTIITGSKVIKTTFANEQKENMGASTVVYNRKNAEFYMNGGSIYSYLDNEIAFANDNTGKLELQGGEIISSGANSIVLHNENTEKNSVVISGGLIKTTGTDSKAVEDKGSIVYTDDAKIEAESQFLVTVKTTGNGTVTPSSIVADAGQVITFAITPDSGYKIADVKVDGASKGAVSTYDLTVLGEHTIEAVFEAKNDGGSTGGSGSGGSSGSSGGSGSTGGTGRIHTSVPTPVIPETPGTWFQDAQGWKLMKADGSAYSNTWVYKNGYWYFLGSDSYMLQGWNLINEAWYYLTPVSGEMKTGWLQDREVWYYLNQDGKMAVNTTTPDGYKVNESGAWIK